MSKIPEKGSSDWKRNEKIIAKNPVLRAARDTAEGFRPSSGITTAGGNSEEYKNNYDQIDFTKRDTSKKSYRVKVNGRYVDEDEQE